MPDLPEDLLAAVTGQAEARKRMDIGGYARYLTPAAVDSLRASFPGIPPRVSRYEIGRVEGRGDDYVVEVRYFVRDDPFVVRSRWRRQAAGWTVVHAERLWPDGRRPGRLSRLLAGLVSFLRNRGSRNN